MTEYAVPIQWAFDIDNQSVLSPHCPNALVKRSQDLPTAYYDAGQFEFFSPDALLNLLDDSFSQYIGYILPSLDVLILILMKIGILPKPCFALFIQSPKSMVKSYFSHSLSTLFWLFVFSLTFMQNSNSSSQYYPYGWFDSLLSH